MTAEATGMLTGVRILDMTHFLAGPFATMTLADLGASVIKLEDPDRPDAARSVGPYMQQGQSLYFATLNAGKRSLSVRLDRPEVADLKGRLIRDTDVVVDNYRPGVMGRLGMDHETLARINPRIITCSLTGFGETGPRSRLPAYDYTVQALAGVMSMTGEAQGAPGKAGVSYVDHSGGLAAGLAVCAALVERGRTNRGRHLDVSLHDVQVSMLSYLASWHLNAGYQPVRMDNSAHPSLVPAQNFQVSDGWISIFVGNDAMWQRFVAALPNAGLEDEGFATTGGRASNRGRLVGLLSDIFGKLTKIECVTLLTKAGVPCAPVNDLHEALADPHVHARGLIREISGAPYGTYSAITGPFPMFTRADPLPAPLLGQDTRGILTEVGLTDSEIDALVRADVVRDGPVPGPHRR